MGVRSNYRDDKRQCLQGVREESWVQRLARQPVIRDPKSRS